jgi:hypothetical protein
MADAATGANVPEIAVERHQSKELLSVRRGKQLLTDWAAAWRTEALESSVQQTEASESSVQQLMADATALVAVQEPQQQPQAQRA